MNRRRMLRIAGGVLGVSALRLRLARARLALRHVLACDVLTAAIPGLITVDQVRNAAAAVQERRQLDPAEARRHEEITREMWASLPLHYGWLREWEWV